MKKLVIGTVIFTMALLTPLKALADCNWATDIEKLPDGRYAYAEVCHRKVGKLVLDAKDRDQQVADLNKSLQLKDLALTSETQRASLWMDSSMKLENKINTIEQYKTTTSWIFFGLGVVFAGAAVYGAGQLVHK